MATLKLAKKREPDLCPVHELRALKGERDLGDVCYEGECMIRTKERLVEDALISISKVAEDAYRSMLIGGDDDDPQRNIIGRTSGMILAIQGLADTALKEVK